MADVQATGYKRVAELKGCKGPVSALTFSSDASLVLVGSDDGHVRVYSTKDFLLLQTLYDSTWSKVTALTYLVLEPTAGEPVQSIVVGNIRGSASLIPKAKQSPWFTQRYSKPIQAFEFNDSVAVQAYDSFNKRLAIASHTGRLKMFSIDADLELVQLWQLPDASPGIPVALKFFGGGNQSLLIHKIETGEMTCLDSHSSTVLWQKHLTCAVGNASLAPREDYLLVHNITERTFQVHHFPGTLPEAALPIKFERHVTIQGIWAEDSKVAVCGSDHGLVYVVNMATREIAQKLSADGLVQAIAAAQRSDGASIIAAGASTGSFHTFVWVKEPPKTPVDLLPATPPTITQRWFFLVNVTPWVLLLAVVFYTSFPSLRLPITASLWNSRFPTADRPHSTVITSTVYATAVTMEPLVPVQSAVGPSDAAPRVVATREPGEVVSFTRTITLPPRITYETVTALQVETQTVTISAVQPHGSFDRDDSEQMRNHLEIGDSLDFT